LVVLLDPRAARRRTGLQVAGAHGHDQDGEEKVRAASPSQYAILALGSSIWTHSSQLPWFA